MLVRVRAVRAAAKRRGMAAARNTWRSGAGVVRSKMQTYLLSTRVLCSPILILPASTLHGVPPVLSPICLFARAHWELFLILILCIYMYASTKLLTRTRHLYVLRLPTTGQQHGRCVGWLVTEFSNSSCSILLT